MKDDSDIYSALLGLPPGPRPPDHYRLLGVELYESNSVRIHAAVERQMARLTPLLLGERASQAQRLIGELAMARAVLSTLAMKGPYDAQLAQGVVPAPSPSVARSPKPPSPPKIPAPSESGKPRPLARDARPIANAGSPSWAPDHPLAGPRAALPSADCPLQRDTTQRDAVLPPDVTVAAPQPVAVPGPVGAPVEPSPVASQPSIETAYVVPAADRLVVSASTLVGRRSRSHPGAVVLLVSILVAVGSTAGVGLLWLSRQGTVAQAESTSDAKPPPPSANQIADLNNGSRAEKDAEKLPGRGSAPSKSAPKVPRSIPAEPETEPMAPATNPPSPAATPEQAAAVRTALTAAREALGQRKLKEADEQLEIAKHSAAKTELVEQVASAQVTRHYVGIFWDAVRESMKTLQDTEELSVGDDFVSVVTTKPGAIVVRVKGENRTYTVENVPPKLAVALAERWLKPGKEKPAFIGAFHVVDQRGDAARGRQILQEAAADGSQAAKQILEELDRP